MQVLLDLGFIPPHGIGLDGSIAVELIRVINDTFKENVLFPAENTTLLWETAAGWCPVIYIVHLQLGCGKKKKFLSL